MRIFYKECKLLISTGFYGLFHGRNGERFQGNRFVFLNFEYINECGYILEFRITSEIYVHKK